MKLISLWEPWATLMALGAKRIETRSWGTSYRGWLAIQASKGGLSQSELLEQCMREQFRAALKNFPTFAELIGAGDVRRIAGVFPHGKIVAVVNLAEICPIDPEHSCQSALFDDYPELDTPQEREFGNYDDPGRYGWVTDNLFRLPEPILFKAKQGLCDVPDPVVAEICGQGFRGLA